MIPGVMLLCAVFGASCTSFRGVSAITYAVCVEEGGKTTEGSFALRLTPQPSGKVQVSVTSSLGGEEFATSFTASRENWLSMLLPAFASRSIAGPLLSVITATQGVYILLYATTQGNLEEGFFLKEKDAEGRESTISITSRETRFGREALWIEMQTTGEGTLKVLMEKKDLIPLVIDLAEEDGKRIHLEATEVTWEEEA